MPSPQATPHRDDLGTNACRQAVLPITALAPIALGHRTSMPPPTVDLEITNGREQLPNTPQRGFPHYHGRRIWGLGYARCRSLRPPPIELVVACLLSQATAAHHSGQWLAVSAMVWSYRLPVLVAGNGSKFQVPGPGGDSETANVKNSRAECIHPAGEPSSPETEGGRYHRPVPDAEGQSIPRQSRIDHRGAFPTPQHHHNVETATPMPRCHEQPPTPFAATRVPTCPDISAV